MPWPVSRIYRVNAKRVQKVTIPASLEDRNGQTEAPREALFWSDDRLSGSLFLAASFKKDQRKKGSEINGSLPVNLASVKIEIHYKITDCAAYYTNCNEPAGLLQYIGSRELTRFMVENDFPWLFKSGIEMMHNSLTSEIQNVADSHQLGVSILHVSIVNLQPPPKVASSYRAVVRAQEGQSQKRAKAEQYAVKIQAQAEQEANRIVKEAESDTSLITNLAEVEKKIYKRQHEAYKKYPQLYKTRSTMDALEEWLKDVRKIVVTTGKAREVINLELKKMQPDLLSVPLE